jgi:hypothetical protein
LWRFAISNNGSDRGKQAAAIDVGLFRVDALRQDDVRDGLIGSE